MNQDNLMERMHGFCLRMQDEICNTLEALDASGARFVRTPWDYRQRGGGVMGLLREGAVFEKAGVNVSRVGGVFPADFAKTIPGASTQQEFEACGLSLVIHPRNPHVPIIHMNVRHIRTSLSWFGGGIDLTPAVAYPEDTAYFHKTLKGVCDRFHADYYKQFKSWCDNYFYLPHRNEPRGVGGIFFDDLNSGDPGADFAFVQAVAESFMPLYKDLVQRRKDTVTDAQDFERLRLKRSRYVEFNLLYDRGTKFGLKTGGNPEAILMSLPPQTGW